MRPFIIILALTAQTAGPPTKPLDQDYTAVRQDVLAQLNLSDLNLPVCEKSLVMAQGELERAQINIDDLKKAADELQTQKRVLEDHVLKLESLLAHHETRDTAAATMVRGWEQVDAPLACAACWAMGTGQCVGLAWIFNQNGFRSGD